MLSGVDKLLQDCPVAIRFPVVKSYFMGKEVGVHAESAWFTLVNARCVVESVWREQVGGSRLGREETGLGGSLKFKGQRQVG